MSFAPPLIPSERQAFRAESEAKGRAMCWGAARTRMNPRVTAEGRELVGTVELGPNPRTIGFPGRRCLVRGVSAGSCLIGIACRRIDGNQSVKH